MSLILKELAQATAAIIEGDETCEIKGIAMPSDARSGDLSFIADNKLLPLLEDCQASVVVIKPEHKGHFKGNTLLHDNPYFVYAKATQYFSPYPPVAADIHPTAIIHDSAKIGDNVSIAAYVVIEAEVIIENNCVIEAGCVLATCSHLGESTHLRANVTIHADTKLGKRCVIHSGAVLGDDGFGFAPYQGKLERIVQMGNVQIGDDVEIGANSMVDRAAINTTLIGNGVKLDNQVQIGHNVVIGENTAIAACTGVAGSTTIGKNCMIGGAVGISGHIEIADGVMITGMSQVTSSLTKPGASYSSGTGTSETGIWRRNVIRFRKLNELAQTVRKLQKQLNKLTDTDT